MIYGLPWTHPALLLFYGNMTAGTWAVYLESHSRLPAGFGNRWPMPLSLLGLVIVSWGPLYMVARSNDWLRPPSLMDLPRQRRSARMLVQTSGYLMASAMLVFYVYRLHALL